MDITKLEVLKVGMKIKISENPTKSETRHGSLSGYKQKLAGTIQTIKQIIHTSDRVIIQNPKSCEWTNVSFVSEDINVLKPLSKIKPSFFDPDQLVFK